MSKRSPARDGVEPDESTKKAKLDDKEPKDPGKTTYDEMRLVLKQLEGLVSRPDKSEEMVGRMRELAEKLASLVSSKAPPAETPNPVKLLQMHLKHTLFNSPAIKDGDNIKTFLNGLEDGSAVKSDEDDTIYVFLANYATELWYQWDEERCEWRWTPEEDGSVWMPCSTLKVSAGSWKDEVPAPENQLIIKYLDAVCPVPSDDQYLPSFCNVVQLLWELARSEEAGFAGVARTVAGGVLDAELASGREEAESVKEALEKLRELVAGADGGDAENGQVAGAADGGGGGGGDGEGVENGQVAAGADGGGGEGEGVENGQVAGEQGEEKGQEEVKEGVAVNEDAKEGSVEG